MEQQSTSFTSTSSEDFSMESSPNTSNSSLASCSSVETDSPSGNVANMVQSGMNVSPGAVTSHSMDIELSRLELQKTSEPGSSGAPSAPALAKLMERTGYSIVQQNGQRRYGPPPNWEGLPPARGSEVFVGKIPRDCFEDELVPVFERVGKIYEVRLMMDHYSESNRGYAFVVFSNALEARECVKQLNNYEIRKGRMLGICMSVDNCRLFVGGIPKKVTKEDIITEMQKVTEGVVDVIVYPSASDKTKNRGFAFVEYESHRSAAMARRKLMNGRVQLWGHHIAVDWAEPELEVDDEIMAQVKVLYVRNLMLTTTEQQIEEAFSVHAPVERVKKIKDYAFVHFHSKETAHNAMEAMNNTMLDGAQVEVTLAKPVDRDSYIRSPKNSKQYNVPAFYVPVDQFGSILPFYPSYYTPPQKYMLRNSMGACTMMHMVRNARGRGRNYLPMSFTSPPQRYMYSPTTTLQAVSPISPISPISPTYYPTTSPGYLEVAAAASAKRSHDDQVAVLEIPQGNATAMAIKTKSSVQLLEEICQKNNWGQPLYVLHSTTTGEDILYLYKITVTAIGVTYIPSKLSRSVEEARTTAADYALIQLGYPMEASTYSPQARPVHYTETQLCPANYVTVQGGAPKPATWGNITTAGGEHPAATAALFASAYADNPYPTPQPFPATAQELYQQGF